jgi:hypothetical protein
VTSQNPSDANRRYSEILHQLGDLPPEHRDLVYELDDVVGERLHEAEEHGILRHHVTERMYEAEQQGILRHRVEVLEAQVAQLKEILPQPAS